MAWYDDQLDLGAGDYSGQSTGVDQFLSKPTQRRYQPFGGPMPPASAYASSQEQPVYEMEQRQPQYTPSPLDELDQYDQFKE